MARGSPDKTARNRGAYLAPSQPPDETRKGLTNPGQASRALGLLSDDERAGVLKYVHVRDAKMALGSHLLKHLAVSKLCGVPWAQTTITRDAAHGKPVFVDAATGRRPLAFNVSHQAGLVALAAVAGYSGGGDDGDAASVDVGVDVVSPAERRARDHGLVAADGWLRFVDMHADVFAPAEANFLKFRVLSAVPGLARGAAPAEVLDFKLRAFYTLWCLREAYVKMTGEALLAAWLGVLEFRDLRPPPLPPAEAQPGDEDGQPAVTAHDIWLRGRRVDDANVCLRSWGPDYMTCTAVRTPARKADGLAFELGPFETLTMEEVLAFAESHM